MDILVNKSTLVRHKFVVAYGVLTALILVIKPFRIFSMLFLYFPGVLLVSQLKKNLDAIEGTVFPLLVGMCFWIVFAYWSSLFPVLNWVTIIIIAGISAGIADTVHISIFRPQQTFLVVLIMVILCCIFMAVYAYPWSQFYQWAPPGDDMKYHALHIINTTTGYSIPHTYGALYPELDTLSYPLGYHAIIAVTTVFTTPTVPHMVMATLFIIPLSCFSFYFLGKSFFNQKVGMYCAFSVSFLSLFFHRLLSTSTYPNVLAITFQVLGISVLLHGLLTKKYVYIWMSVLICAAASLTHSYIFLITMFFLILLTLLFLVKKEISKVKMLVLATLGIMVVLIPFFVRLEFYALSNMEMKTFSTWYTRDALNSVPDILKSISLLSPLLLVFSGLGAVIIKENTKYQKYILFSWIAAVIGLPVLSAFPIFYPGWYTISPDRFFIHVFAPLCVLSGKFLADAHKELNKNVIYFVGILILLSVGMHHFNVFHSFSPDPVTHVQMNPDDDFVMKWITKNTAHDAIILNTGPAVDCSSWVHVICNRRIVFPYFSGHRGDKCIKTVKAHLKREDLRIVKHTPDSRKALDILKKYDIDYVYIPSWRKWHYFEIYPEKFLQSPLYTPVVKKGDAYLFRVEYTKIPNTAFLVVEEKEKNTVFVNKNGYFISFDPVISPDAQGHYYVQIAYTDLTYGYIDIYEGTHHLETIFTFESGKKRVILIPLSDKKVDVKLYADPGLHMDKITILYGIKNAFNISDSVALHGDWCMTGSDIVGLAGMSNLRIYVANPQSYITMMYQDTGYGNVDINISDIEKEWPGILVVYRQNTDEIKMVHIPTKKYAVVVYGVHVNENDFIVKDIII